MSASTDRVWRVGHEYRDRGGYSFEDDEILRWLHTECGTIANSGGIRYKDPVSQVITDPETARLVPAYFVLITRDMSAQHHNPWDDVVDEVSGNIVYWGDAKFSDRSKTYAAFKGNARLEAANNIRLIGRISDQTAREQASDATIVCLPCVWRGYYEGLTFVPIPTKGLHRDPHRAK